MNRRRRYIGHRQRKFDKYFDEYTRIVRNENLTAKGLRRLEILTNVTGFKITFRKFDSPIVWNPTVEIENEFIARLQTEVTKK